MEISWGFLYCKQFVGRRHGIEVKWWLDNDSRKQNITDEQNILCDCTYNGTIKTYRQELWSNLHLVRSWVYICNVGLVNSLKLNLEDFNCKNGIEDMEYYIILKWRLRALVSLTEYLRNLCVVYGGADKSLAWPGRKQGTVTKLGIYWTYSPRSSIHFLAHCSNFCKPLKKKKKNQKFVCPNRSLQQQRPPHRTENGDLSIIF